jgi:hypothetical protein
MSNIIGVRNNSTIVPYANTTKQTKVVDFSAAGFLTGPSGWVTSRFTMQVFVDSAGIVKCWINFRGTCTEAARNGLNFTIASTAAIKFKNLAAFYQPFSGETETAALNYTLVAVTNPNASSIYVNNSTGGNLSTVTYSVNGTVELEEIPAWAAANMEGVVAADVYIPPASATSAGLLSYYATGTHSTTIGNMLASAPTAAISWVRVNNQVTISLDAVVDAPSKANNVAPFTITPLPVALRPSVVRSGPAFILQNGSHDVGIIYVAVDGSVTWYRNWDALAWTASVGARLQPTSFTYNL